VRLRPLFLFLSWAVLFFLQASTSGAGGPLAVSSIGVPYTWDNSAPILFNPDQGSLGLLDNDAAVQLVQEAFEVWSSDAIPTVTLSFENGGSLPEDVNTLLEYLSYQEDNGGTNAIIFDTDGSIVADLGLPPEVVGFAGPELVTTKAPYHIVEGLALLNGAFVDGNEANGEISQEDFKIAFRHEFGHFLNLDHTQVNGHFFLGDNDDPGFIEYGAPPPESIHLMFPFFLEGIPSSIVPISDDIAAISSLYPSSEFASSGMITGTVLESDGSTPFQGANVIARNTADPFFDVVSNVSGARYCAGPLCPGSGTPDPELEGLYELPGLTSGRDYLVEVVNINEEFSEGSAVGPLPNPVAICGPEEFYNGMGESEDANLDDPLEFVAVSVGSTVSDVNFIFNHGEEVATVTPPSHDFGGVLLGVGTTEPFLIENTGGGTLNGRASVSLPFSIISGGSYSLESGESQILRVGFSPTSSGTFSETVVLSCGGGEIIVMGTGESGSSGGSGSSSGDSGCFIATAAYGSPMEKHVQLLRVFRERFLFHLPGGQEAVSLYYQASPPIADLISGSESLRFLSVTFLIMGRIRDTRYSDRKLFRMFHNEVSYHGPVFRFEI